MTAEGPIRGRVLEASRGRVVLGLGGPTLALTLPEGRDVRVGDWVEAVHGELVVVSRPSRSPSPQGDALRGHRARAGRSLLDRLRARHQVLRALRATLDSMGFLELEAPLLVRGSCPDLAIESFRVGDHYLTTSTEYAIKRLLVAGAARVYTLTKNFRAGDLGPVHAPEFTMLEWGRAFEGLDAIERDAEHLLRAALAAVSSEAEHLVVRGQRVRVAGVPFERIGVREALAERLGVRVDEAFSLESVREAARALDVGASDAALADRHFVVSVLLDRLSERLGHEVPTWLREWPSFLTSSAEVSEAPVGERSELFVAGVELADGFPALRSAERQRTLFARENARRRAEGRHEVALDERYLAGLEEGLPPSAGMALGVDRLVLAVTGASELADVVAFGWDEL
jgi:lysyl-tRNA synthetase class 2